MSRVARKRRPALLLLRVPTGIWNLDKDAELACLKANTSGLCGSLPRAE
jgi:hypothetical protein